MSYKPGSTRRLTVWHFLDAPPELQALSDHAGDEDYVFMVPAGMFNDDPAYDPIPYWLHRVVERADMQGYSGGAETWVDAEFEGQPVKVCITAHA